MDTFEGRLVSIAVAPTKAARMRSVDRARIVPGKGVEGDRYAEREGTFTASGDGVTEVTLIEVEAIEAIARDQKISVEPRDARRNLVTRGVPLNHLVGRRFRVGEVVLEGTKLCEPCKHLESLTAPGVRDALVHRGGLEARIVRGGVVSAGDAIRPVGDGAAP
jgi:MOSC domain-containing protein YiiM